MSFSGKSLASRRRESFMIEVTTPLIRLSRPGNNAMRVIPPLRGLERAFACANCHTELFTLANVVRVRQNVLNVVCDRDLGEISLERVFSSCLCVFSPCLLCMPQLDMDLTSMLDVDDVRSETASSVDDFDERLSTDGGGFGRSSFGSFRLSRESKIVDHRPQRGIAFGSREIDTFDDGRSFPAPPRTKVPESSEFSFDAPIITLAGPPRSPRGRRNGSSTPASEGKADGIASPRTWTFPELSDRRSRSETMLSSEPGTPVDAIAAREALTREEVMTPTPKTPPLSPYSQLHPSTPFLSTPQLPSTSPSRPLSAEKRRWLERVSQLDFVALFNRNVA